MISGVLLLILLSTIEQCKIYYFCNLYNLFALTIITTCPKEEIIRIRKLVLWNSSSGIIETSLIFF